ncbi:MAG: LysR family transcriptional regulator [Actinomycetota bacterium]
MDWLRDAPRLRAFLAVTDAGSFTAAARRLGVSQPAVSAHVAALERELGERLVTRDRAGARVTPAGAAFRPHAARLLATAEAAAVAVDGVTAPRRRHLRVAGGEVLMSHVLPPALARLRASLPRLTAVFTIADDVTVVEALRGGAVEFGLVTDRAPVGDLPYADVGEDRLVGLVPAGHRLATRTRLPVAALAAETLVARDAGAVDRRETEHLLAQHGVSPRGRLIAHSFEAAHACVAAGLGVAVAPGIAARHLPDAVAAVPIAEAPRLVYRLVSAASAPPTLRDALTRALREEIAG